MASAVRRVARFATWTLVVLIVLAVIAAIIGFFLIRSFVEPDRDAFGTVQDEAMRAGLTRTDFPAAGEPYFAAMDKGLLLLPGPGEPYPDEVLEVAEIAGLTPEEVRQAAIRGQNTWTVWTGGNDRFWDFAAQNTLGSFDLLKILSSHPSQGYGRYSRWRWLGLVNEPCFEQGTAGDPERYGLWFDVRDPDCPDDPFADAEAYPGVAVGARGDTIPVGSYYGEPSGVVGLRLFPNPDFDEAAAAAWDPERFYTDPDYYDRADLVRPYRVGMSCAFCHVGPSPINPPADPEAPTWAELNSNPGAQYYWVNRVFFWDTRPREEAGKPAPNENNLLYQLFHTNPPGTLDTSLVSTDYMNNPRTMNAVYEVRARLEQAASLGLETLDGEERANKQFQDYEQTAALKDLYDAETGEVASMRVLKDGADSVGTLGALNRVYLNIGLFSEEWLLHFRPFLGGQKISPIRIEDAQANSVYWGATEDQTADMAIFFLVTARADRLADAPGGAQHLLPLSSPDVMRGKVVFAENCAACHSSKQPEPPASFEVDTGSCAGGGAGPDYRACWDRYWAWTRSDAFKAAMAEKVLETDADGNDVFLQNNFLSNERRVPIDVVGTNACSAIATNGLDGDIWDNFTSDSYKQLPPPEPVTVNHPDSGGAITFESLGNGRGYLRPASLVSLWSTGPYLLNNALGHNPEYYAADYYYDGYYSGDYGVSCPATNAYDPYLPCVDNRVAVFEESIQKLLNPELRYTDRGTAEPIPGYMYRTTAPSCVLLPAGFAPDIVRDYAGLLSRVAPWAVQPNGSVTLGPLPEGFPINTLLNTKLLPDNDEPEMFGHVVRLLRAGPTLIGAFKELGGQCTAEQLADPATQVHAERVVRESGLVDTLVGLSKCPDYVVNRGHTFGAELPAADKEALIAYLKHF